MLQQCAGKFGLYEHSVHYKPRQRTAQLLCAKPLSWAFGPINVSAASLLSAYYCSSCMQSGMSYMPQQHAKWCCVLSGKGVHSCHAYYMCRAQVRLQALPEQGCILVSHPLLRDAYSSYFHQTVVLLCRHSFASGTYGLFLNRFLSDDAKAKVDRTIRGSGSPPPRQAAASSSGLDLARDMPAAMQAMLGQPFTASDLCRIIVYVFCLSCCRQLVQYVSVF